MRTPWHRNDTLHRNRLLHAGIFLVAMMSFAFNSANAYASNLGPSDYRFAFAGDKFDGTRLYAVAYKLRPPRRLRAAHLELAVGTFSTRTEDRAFVSFGPVWRLPFENQPFFVELGISPTLFGGSHINGRDLGGNFHFTSSIAIGSTFGRRQSVSVSLRAQHTSNGGLHSNNPGIDMFGINFAFNFSN